MDSSPDFQQTLSTSGYSAQLSEVVPEVNMETTSTGESSQQLYSGSLDNSGSGDIAVDMIELVIQRFEKSIRFHCPTCFTSFRDSFQVQRHFSIVHSDPGICDRCKNVFVDKFSLTKHKKGCLFLCTWMNCDKKFQRKERFDSHIRYHNQLARRMF